MSDELFHYTTAEGLKGIVENKCLWATDHRFLNDTSEGRPLLNWADLRCRALVYSWMLSRLPSNLSDLKREAKLQLGKVFVDSISTKALEVISTDIGFYAACFNEHDLPKNPSEPNTQVEGMLSQWRAYSKFGGYCVVFKKAELLHGLVKLQNERIKSSNSAGTTEALELVAKACSYSDLTESDQTHVGPWIDQVTERLLLSVQTGEYAEYSYFSAQFLKALEVLPFYKDPGFIEEQEFRIAAVFHRGSTSSYAHLTRKFRTKDGVIVPYVELSQINSDGQTDALPIARIIVGPAKNQARSRLGVEALLARFCPNQKIEIHESSIPYQE